MDEMRGNIYEIFSNMQLTGDWSVAVLLASNQILTTGWKIENILDTVVRILNKSDRELLDRSSILESKSGQTIDSTGIYLKHRNSTPVLGGEETHNY